MNIYIPDMPIMIKVKKDGEVIKGYLVSIVGNLWTIVTDDDESITVKEEDIVEDEN